MDERHYNNSAWEKRGPGVWLESGNGNGVGTEGLIEMVDPLERRKLSKARLLSRLNDCLSPECVIFL